MNNQLKSARRTAIYARVSSSKQSEEGTIESQINVLLEHARNHELEIPEGWIFQDNGVSGSTIQRPALDNLRDLVASGAPDAILIYHPDRLARKYVYQILLLEEFTKNGVQIIFHKNKKAETPEELLLEHFQGVFAEYERAQITERCRRGRLYKARQGSTSVIPNAPYGYRYVNESGTPYYALDPEESKTILKLFQMYGQEGKGIADLVRYMNESGKKTRKSSLGWDRATIRKMLQNRTYTGRAGFCKTEKCEGNPKRIVRAPKSGRMQNSKFARKDCPEETWITISVPSIVSEDLYAIVQEKLANSQRFAARNTKIPSILQGVLVCGLCGGSYYKKTRSNAAASYCCHRTLQKTEKECNNRSIRQKELDDYIWNWVVSILSKPQLVEAEIKRRAAEDPDRKRTIEKKQTLHREQKKLENSRNKLLDAYTESECLSLEEFKKRMDILNRQTQQLKRELAVIETQTADEERMKQSRLTLEKFARSIANSASELSVEEKQRVIRALIDEVVIYQDSVKVRHNIPMGNDKHEKCPLTEERSFTASRFGYFDH